MKNLFFLLLKKRLTINWLVALLCIVTYFSFVINIPIFRHLINIFSETDQISWLFMLSITIVIFTIILAIFSLFSFKYIFKPITIFLLITSGPVLYSQLYYNIVFDLDMIQNFAQTNIHEAKSYLTVQSFIFVFLVSVIPSLVLLFTKITYPQNVSPLKSILKRLSIFIPCLVLLSIIVFSLNNTLVPFIRNNKILPKEFIPLNYISSSIRYIKKQYFHKELPFVVIGDDARIDNPNKKPEIMVVIIGETARAANFKQNGYNRNTTPYTNNIPNSIFYKNVRSCGTATAISLPCMFSSLTRDLR